MERLWTPWRMAYILSDKKAEGCIFCLKAQETKDAENYIVYRGQRAFVILNIFPYNNGHLMVSPYQHVPSLECLEPDTLAELMRLVSFSIVLLRQAMHPQGFNIGVNIGKMAGAGIDDHVHIHVVPRWAGDTNFMPILAETRVVPELLDETYRKLREVIDAGTVVLPKP